MKQKPTDYRNRIKALEYVNSADLAAHPGNWRDHPAAQAEALKGVLAEVGIAGALLAYRSERQGGALVVIDGHLRKDAAPQAWPVLILDVSDSEADYILSTHDPLAAMATADAGALDALLSSVQSGEAAVQSMLAELAEGAGLYQPKDGKNEDRDKRRGYSVGSKDITGRCLWTEVNFGFDVVKRLKNTRPLLIDEIHFYGNLLARLVPIGFEPQFISYPPSSMKVMDEEYFAALLANVVGESLGVPVEKTLHNPQPRKHRAVRQEKLRETSEDTPYEYVGPLPAGAGNVLMVDDVIFTRRTANRCQTTLMAAGFPTPYWIVLYVA